MKTTYILTILAALSLVACHLSCSLGPDSSPEVQAHAAGMSGQSFARSAFAGAANFPVARKTIFD